MNHVSVIGAGLAGCEAAWQLARRGIAVTLYERKPVSFSPAHSSADFAELVCSNSLKAERMDSAAGLLKLEMAALGSLLVPCAQACRVPAGGALAVDREAFSRMVTEKIAAEPRITVRREELDDFPDGPVIVATGPLTADRLARADCAAVRRFAAFLRCGCADCDGGVGGFGRGVLCVAVRTRRGVGLSELPDEQRRIRTVLRSARFGRRRAAARI